MTSNRFTSRDTIHTRRPLSRFENPALLRYKSTTHEASPQSLHISNEEAAMWESREDLDIGRRHVAVATQISLTSSRNDMTEGGSK
jgi:hypothetical protein